jgi:hypothetical protein
MSESGDDSDLFYLLCMLHNLYVVSKLNVHLVKLPNI